MTQVHTSRALAVAAASGCVTWWLAATAGVEAATASLESLVAAAVLLAGAGAALGIGVLCVAALAQSALGWRPRAVGALPAPVRRFLVGSVAAAVAAGVAVPASAEDAYPGWAPPTPAAQPAPPRTESVEAAPKDDSTHIVLRGESLWKITADLLGPDATDAQIAATWPVVYRANRHVIGDNPSLILPGQRLAIPSAVRS